MIVPSISTMSQWGVGCILLFLLYWAVRWWANGFHFLLIALVLACGILVAFLRHNGLRAFALISLSVLLMLFIIEYGFLINKRFSPQQTKAQKTFSCGKQTKLSQRDIDLGYRGVPGPIVCTFTLMRDQNNVHEGTYSLDEHGFRVTPEISKDGESILFFGGSNMLGELVNDDETLPYYVSRRLDHRYNIVNLGWSGWGPHQMLRLLEVEVLKDVVTGRLRGAVFKTAIWHTQRVVGYSAWDQTGPMYRRNNTGDIVYAGPFKSETRLEIEKYLKQSLLFEWLYQRTQKISSQDIELYIDIIVKSSSLLQEKYGVPLTVLFFPSPNQPEHYGGYTPEMVVQRLRQEGLIVLKTSDVLNYKAAEMIIEGDGHPSPLAYSREAELVSSVFSPSDKKGKEACRERNKDC